MKIVTIILYVGIFYLGLIIFSQLMVDLIAFHPPRTSYSDNINILKLKTSKGANISAVYFPSPNAKYTILYNHGNAEDLGYLIPFLKLFNAHGISVFAYDYQGYGTSDGKPSEENMYSDANAAYQYMTQQLGILPERIIVYGVSIGSAAAIELAVHKPISGLILQSPFVSGFRIFTHWSLLPFDHFNNIAKINEVKSPILFIHGESDEIIPVWHTQALSKKVKQPIQVYFVPNAGHNDLISVADKEYWNQINAFIKALEN